MILIKRPETDPWFNIAAEEYFLKNKEDNIVMLWQSDTSVIVGKHQNTLAEVNLELARELQIPVIRRISGGGTVFHDMGNINYTVITSEKQKDRLIDFRKFTRPIIAFLKEIGIHTVFEGKNNLVIRGKKISGNSGHVYKNRVLHHGTLLFDSNLEKLDKLIKPEKLDIQDKAVKSIRATVTNISGHLIEEISRSQFISMLQQYLMRYYDITEAGFLSGMDKNAIRTLANEKYKTWKWNLGYSPAFSIKLAHHDQVIELNIKNGLIQAVIVTEKTPFSVELAQLKGTPYRRKDITEKLMSLGLHDTDRQTCVKLLGF
jgi:lipoate-protein ligase A